jgi:hypothetical protein
MRFRLEVVHPLLLSVYCPSLKNHCSFKSKCAIFLTNVQISSTSEKLHSLTAQLGCMEVTRVKHGCLVVMC